MESKKRKECGKMKKWFNPVHICKQQIRHNSDVLPSSCMIEGKLLSIPIFLNIKINYCPFCGKKLQSPESQIENEKVK